MKKKYYQRKQSISRKVQPFFSEGGFRIDRKEEPQSFFQTKREGLIHPFQVSGIQKAAIEEEEPDIQRKIEEEEEIQRQPEEEEEVMLKPQSQE